MPDPAERHADTLARWVPLDGRDALDVGCGGGGFLRALGWRGAHAVGLEIDDAQLARARAAGHDDTALRVGRAEALPFPDASFDLVCCLFSFHHFPADVQTRAVAEAARVLRPGGALFVVEPTPDGALTEVIQPIEDETEVRTRSLALLRADAFPGLTLRAETGYEVVRTFRRPEDLISMALDVDPARGAQADNPAVRAEVVARFARLAAPTADSYALSQPCAAFLFDRAAYPRSD
jgi:SAM-dependent methyltransferase